MVRSDAFAGVERSVALLSRGLAAEGLDVTVIGGDPPRMVAELRDSATFEPAATTLGVANALRRQRPFDIVHAHMTAAEVAALLARPVVRAPVVATRHFAIPRGRGRMRHLVRWVLSRSLAAQISVSDHVAAAIGEPSITIPHGVAASPGGLHHERLVVVVQRFEREKATDLALRAWAASGIGALGWRLGLAGEGSQMDELRGIVRELAIADSVEFLGFVADVAPLLDRAAIMIAPSPNEGLGYSVVEAMATGLPVVAADAGGHRTTVGPVAPELLFPPGDAAACAAILRVLVENPTQRKALGSQLRRFQETNLSLDNEIQRTLAVYNAVLSNARAGADR